MRLKKPIAYHEEICKSVPTTTGLFCKGSTHTLFFSIITGQSLNRSDRNRLRARIFHSKMLGCTIIHPLHVGPISQNDSHKGLLHLQVVQ